MSSSIIITAAHCVYESKPKRTVLAVNIVIFAGAVNITDNLITRRRVCSTFWLLSYTFSLILPFRAGVRAQRRSLGEGEIVPSPETEKIVVENGVLVTKFSKIIKKSIIL